MTPAVWIIVLNWNGRVDTLELLEGLSKAPATVVVVDNGSNDGTIEAVQASFPEVVTLQTGANLGYPGGNNAGIAWALKAGADVVGVLNNDTLVEPTFLAPLLAVLDRGGVAVSPDIRYAEEPGLSWWRGSRLDPREGWPQHLGPLDQVPEDGEPVSMPVLTGCCIIASATTWRLVGGFDERMFLMFEDSDWSRRAAELGIDLLVVPRSRIRHKVSRSFTGAAGALGTYYFSRNGAIFAWRHLGASAAARFLVFEVLRPTFRQLADPTRRRSALMAYLGLIAAVFGKRGIAGRIATSLARRASPAANHVTIGPRGG